MPSATWTNKVDALRRTRKAIICLGSGLALVLAATSAGAGTSAGATRTSTLQVSFTVTSSCQVAHDVLAVSVRCTYAAIAPSARRMAEADGAANWLIEF